MDQNGINKTVVYSLIIGGTFITLIGVMILIVVRPDASGTLIQFVGSLPILLGSVVAIVYGQLKNGKVLETVQRQTNGTLSKLVDHATGTVPLEPEELAELVVKVKEKGGM
jgi:hypothetical protein